MKYLSLMILCLLLIACFSDANLQIDQADEVLICKSSTAESYHRQNCAALKQCSHQVGKVNIEEAKVAGRKPCGRCY